MKRLIAFLMLAAVLAYMGVIYRSSSLIYLFYALVCCVGILFLYNLYLIYHIRITMDIPYQIVEKGKEIPVELELRSSSVLPSGRIAIRLEVKNVRDKKKQTASFFSFVPGKRIGRTGRGNEGSALVRGGLASRTSGRVQVRVKGVWLYDLLGILKLPVPGKRRHGFGEVVVLPKACRIPVVPVKNGLQPSYSREFCPGNVFEQEPPEVYDIRNYRPGDSLRSIHWKLSAKSDELIVRESQIETEAAVVLFLDWRRGKEPLRKYRKRMEYLNIVLLSLSESLLEAGCAHYVVWYGGQEDVLRCRVSQQEHVYQMMAQVSIPGERKQPVSIREAYAQKYHSVPGQINLILRETLCLQVADSQTIQYTEQGLEKSLQDQTIYLGGKAGSLGARK
ncbi:MAG: DUF58 domain-containing protein [Clostridiaceae bacterium]|nr:DUF58 domain-containing protein [Clostridiaceae bacterium]